MKRLFLFTLIALFALLNFVSIPAEAALDVHSGYANHWSLAQGDELPYTYGETKVESMWTSGRWAYSTHSIFIGNYAGGPFGPQDIDFDVTYVCEIKGTNRLERIFEQSVKTLKPYYDDNEWKKSTWSDSNRQLRVRRDGLESGDYTFEAYTELDARDADRVRDSATWRAEHSILISAF